MFHPLLAIRPVIFVNDTTCGVIHINGGGVWFRSRSCRVRACRASHYTTPLFALTPENSIKALLIGGFISRAAIAAFAHSDVVPTLADRPTGAPLVRTPLIFPTGATKDACPDAVIAAADPDGVDTGTHALSTGFWYSSDSVVPPNVPEPVIIPFPPGHDTGEPLPVADTAENKVARWWSINSPCLT